MSETEHSTEQILNAMRVLIAEMRGEVNTGIATIKGEISTALAEIRRHDSELAILRGTVEIHGKQIVELQTSRVVDSGHAERTLSAKQTTWIAISGIAGLAAVIVTVLLAVLAHH
jgi:hypothetical protein